MEALCAILIVIVVVWGLIALIGSGNGSYQDGQQYGGWFGGVLQGQTTCSQSDMDHGYRNDPGPKPNDDYSQWRAGCLENENG